MNPNNTPIITTLLLVDDDPDDQEFFKLALSEIRKEICCKTAYNGKDALNQLVSEACNPDLIFLDINMPLMNGFAFLEIIKETDHFKHIPVIMYSTSHEQREINNAKSMGASAYIIKPAKLADLCHSLLQILSRHTAI